MGDALDFFGRVVQFATLHRIVVYHARNRCGCTGAADGAQPGGDVFGVQQAGEHVQHLHHRDYALSALRVG